MPEKLADRDANKMIADASNILREEAKFRWPSLDYHQERIWRLREWLKWTHRRVRSIYNREDGVVLTGAEALRLKEIEADQKARKGETNATIRKSQAEYRELEARIAALESLFAAVDAEHGQPHVDGLRAYARGEGYGPQDTVLGPDARSEGNGPQSGRGDRQ